MDVLIVEERHELRERLQQALAALPDIALHGAVPDPVKALEAAVWLRPGVMILSRSAMNLLPLKPLLERTTAVLVAAGQVSEAERAQWRRHGARAVFDTEVEFESLADTVAEHWVLQRGSSGGAA